MWLVRSPLWLVALACSGTALTPAPPDAAPATVALAFEVRGVLTPTRAVPTPAMSFPAEQDFAAFVDLRSDPPRLVVSQDGAVGEAPLQRLPDGWQAMDEAVLKTTVPSDVPCLNHRALHFSTLQLLREGEGIRGTATGRIEFSVGDIIQTVLFDATLAGAPDRRPPVARIESAPVHPADELRVRLSEAVPAATTVRLVGPDGSERMLKPAGDFARQAALFVLEAPVGVLRGHRLVFEPALTDLAGNTGAAPPPLDSLAIPLLPEDGFEGASGPLLSGRARLVDGSVYPPVAGRRSLYVPAPAYAAGESRATLRLAVAPGDTVVRATVRAILAPDDRYLNFGLQLIGPGGTRVALPATEVKGPITVVGGVSLGAPQPIELPLPAGSADEVIVDVWVGPGCGFFVGGPGALLDDLRVE